MSATSTDTTEEIKATIASVGRRVWLANFTMRALKVIEYVLTIGVLRGLPLRRHLDRCACAQALGRDPLNVYSYTEEA